MTDLDEKQFHRAVAEAIRGVLNVYREADALLRELRDGLRSGTPAFSPVVDRLVPGLRGDADARYLRRYIATILTPLTASPDNEPDDDDDDDEDGDDDSDEVGKKKVSALDIGTALLIARVSLYGPGGVDFVPKLTLTTLRNVRIDGGPSSGQLKMSNNRYKKLIRALDNQQPGIGTIKPKLTTHPLGKPKDKRGMVFDISAAPTSYSLYTITPQHLELIVTQVRNAW